MGCGCKKKHEVQPQQQPAKVILKEGIPPRPPQPILTPQQQQEEINKIAEKLNQILTPQNP
jgi:hypothetical protein